MFRVMDPQERDFYRSFGDALRAARLAKGMSRAKLARRLRVSYTTIVNWELGQTRPVLHQYVMLCENLGFNLGWACDLNALEGYLPRGRRHRTAERKLGLTARLN